VFWISVEVSITLPKAICPEIAVNLEYQSPQSEQFIRWGGNVLNSSIN
jgi:hypothetical protein